MTRTALLLFSTMAASAVAAQQAAPVALASRTVRVLFADHELSIDRPSSWKDSRIRGGGVQLHLVGGASGFPHFTVQSDAGAGLPAKISAVEERQLVEELFSALIGSVNGTTVLRAAWSGFNGLRVHDSVRLRPSVAGPIKMRRLLFLHAGVPYVVSWEHRSKRMRRSPSRWSAAPAASVTPTDPATCSVVERLRHRRTRRLAA